MASEVAGFPGDSYWQRELGVDVAAVEKALEDRDEVVRWLVRQGEALISLLEARAGLAPGPKSKKARCVRLVEAEAGLLVVRQALICREYLESRRKEALAAAVRSIAFREPAVQGLEGAAGDPLCTALVVAWAAAGYLPWFGLWDQALRVGYRERRLVRPGRKTEKAPAAGEKGRGRGLDRLLVEEVLGGLGGLGELRTVGVVPAGDGDGHLVFLLEFAGSRRVHTLDGIQRVGGARWIVLHFEDGWERLFVHGPEERGARIAEAIAARVLGERTVSYEPYRPASEAASVAAWARRMIESPPVEIRLYDVDVTVDTEPAVRWRIYGEVKTGLERLAQSAGVHGLGALVSGLVQVNLGYRQAPGEPWCRFTVRVRKGASENARFVTFQGHGAAPARRRAFQEWLEEQGVLAAVT